MQMTFIDFFSGIVSFRAGLEACGMKCIGHCEIDKYVDRSYRGWEDEKMVQTAKYILRGRLANKYILK